MAATIIFIHKEIAPGDSGEPLALVTNDDKKSWRFEILVAGSAEKTPPAPSNRAPHVGFLKIEHAFAACLMELQIRGFDLL
jgi:hypothetical protein